MRMKRACPTIFVGVDPAMHRSGCAFRIEDNPIAYDAVDGIRNLASANIVETLQLVWLHVTAEHGTGATPTVVLCVEYPTWSGPGPREVRGAANQWIEEVKRRFPRKVRVYKVDPKDWQRELLAGCPGAGPKERYVFRAIQLLEDRVEDIGQDEAAAICLMEYGKVLNRLSVASGTGRKGQARTVAAYRRRTLGRRA